MSAINVVNDGGWLEECIDGRVPTFGKMLCSFGEIYQLYSGLLTYSAHPQQIPLAHHHLYYWL